MDIQIVWDITKFELNELKSKIKSIKKDKIHEKEFVGVSPLEEFIKNLYSDYKEYLIQDKIVNSWNYK